MSNVLLLRLNDHASDVDVRPADATGNLEELGPTGADMPPIADAALGFGRVFTSSSGLALAAVDADGGSTLLTRTMSIQAVLEVDFDAMVAAATPATIYARGKGTGAAEYASAILELRVVNAALRIAELRWAWHDLGGVLRTQIGGHFQMPTTGSIMLTATRRWASSSRVVLCYYLGDAPLAEVESSDGEIGGGTTGTTSIGARYTGGAWDNFLEGVLDELRVTDDELAPEEVAMTWRRITIEQPRGYALLHGLHDPGFPISQDPASRAQRETRLWGNALGYAAAQAENVRENLPPDRAYGRALELWETATKQAPRPGDDLELRRRRVVGKLRQRRGVSIPGIGDALAGVRSLLDTDLDELEIVAFDQTYRDTWATLNPRRWRYQIPAAWSVAGGALLVTNPGGFLEERATWPTALAAMQGDGEDGAIYAKLDPSDDLEDEAEVGLWFVNMATWDAILVGIRGDGDGYDIVRTEMIGRELGASTVIATRGALDPVWLALDQTGAATYRVRHAFAAPSSPDDFVEAGGIAGPASFQWGGFYARSISGSPAFNVKISATALRAPHGDRTSHLYIVRDPALPGSPDYDGANAVLRGLKQAHTVARVVRSLEATYDETTYDDAPAGGV